MKSGCKQCASTPSYYTAMYVAYSKTSTFVNFPKDMFAIHFQTRLKWQIHEQLKTFTDYVLVVQAFNRMGAGPKSQEVIVTTMEDGKLYHSDLLYPFRQKLYSKKYIFHRQIG